MKITYLRKRKNLTQEHLATLCNTTQQQIAKIENGVVDPKLSTIEKIADALGCEIQALFYSKKEFVDVVNQVITENKLNIKTDGMIKVNYLCAKTRSIPPFHSFWEKIQISNNKVKWKD